MFAALPFEARPLNHVPEMRDDAHLREELAVLVEVDAPGIATAFGEHFKDVPCGMITPHAGIHPLPLAVGRARLADVRRAEHAVTSIKPAVWSPRESVQYLVCVGSVIPTIEKKFGIAGGFRTVPIVHLHEH